MEAGGELGRTRDLTGRPVRLKDLQQNNRLGSHYQALCLHRNLGTFGAFPELSPFKVGLQ